MSENYVAQGPCSAVLLTVHGCHYAFQKFLFFVSLCIYVLLSIENKGGVSNENQATSSGNP